MLLLQQQGLESFCPLQRARHQWSDRVKTVEKPLLKSYVFVKVAEDQRTAVRLTEGVVNFVNRNGKPVMIKDKTIQDIRQFQENYPEISVVETNSQEPIGKNKSEQSLGKPRLPTLTLDMLDLTLIAILHPQMSFVATDNI